VAALDEPDVGFVSAADDFLVRVDLEKLRVEGALIEQEGQAACTTLFGSVWHWGASMLSRRPWAVSL
jgi:hypothetical protein